MKSIKNVCGDTNIGDEDFAVSPPKPNSNLFDKSPPQGGLWGEDRETFESIAVNGKLIHAEAQRKRIKE